MKSLAAVLTKHNADLEYIELGIPELRRGQVLVKLIYSSICHTQINEIKGNKGHDPYIPHTLGHEGSGEVVAVGQGVSQVGVGDKVLLTWLQTSGISAGGSVYESSIGKVNSGPVSTFLTYAVISEDRLIKVDTIPLDILPLFGCAIPTGMGIIDNDLKVEEGKSVCIWGQGGIGLCSLIAAKFKGASPIIAIDIDDEKLALAKELGADYVINSKSDDAVSEIFKILNAGADYGVDATGSVSVIEMGLKSVSSFGGTFIIAGNPKVGQNINIDPYEFIKGKKLIGSWGGGGKLGSRFSGIEKVYLANQSIFRKLIKKKYHFSEINQAVKDMQNGLVGRVLIDFSEHL